MEIEQQIKKALESKKAQVKRPARGFIKHDYLVPAGPYEEQWDWDAFFVGMSLASEISSEAIYLKNWALNYLEHVGADGYTPGLLTPRGVDRRLKHVKPFLAQGAFFAGQFLNDYEWLRPYWSQLERSVRYREKKNFDRKRGLGCWYNSMESGADNNVAALDYPNGTVIAVDLNSFLYREYLAMAKLAGTLGKTAERRKWQLKATAMKRAIVKYLWDPKDQYFYNLDTRSGLLIKRVSYSGAIPLWAGIADPKQGRAMIRSYLLNPNKLWGKYGIRTLSKDDRAYNNRNIIKPYSNWQGPVWPIANYFYFHALLQYGFKKEARRLAIIIADLCLQDLKTSGGMHENYHADTGKPLAAPDFISWNLLVGQMIPQATSGVNPFRL